jgi:hypothetical protein
VSDSHHLTLFRTSVRLTPPHIIQNKCQTHTTSHYSEQVSDSHHLTLFRYAGYGYNKDTLVCYKEDGTRLHVLSGSADLVSAIAVGSDGKMYSAHNRNVLMW